MIDSDSIKYLSRILKKDEIAQIEYIKSKYSDNEYFMNALTEEYLSYIGYSSRLNAYLSTKWYRRILRKIHNLINRFK